MRPVDVRPTERRALWLAFAYFFALLASYYLLRPVRDEMGARGRSLQWDFSATFATLLVAVPVYSALFARVRRTRAVPLVYRFFLVNLVVFWAAFRSGVAPAVVGRAFFVWLSVFNLLVVSVFWSFMADLFDAEQARRLFGFVAAGGSLGAIAGSAAAGLLVGRVGVAGLVALAAVLLEVSARCAVALSRAPPGAGPSAAAPRDEPLGGTALSGAAAVLRSPYLLALSAQVLLFTFASTFLYVQTSRLAADALTDPARRTAFFAAVDLGVNLVSLALQALATGRVAAAFGLAPALAAVPLVSLAGFAAAAAAPTLLVLGGAQAARRVVHFALEKPARDVLYTVVPREQKYKSKGFIETVVYRGGDALAGWLYAGLLGLGLASGAVALAGVPVAAGSLAVGLWLARRERRMEGAVARAPVEGA